MRRLERQAARLLIAVQVVKYSEQCIHELRVDVMARGALIFDSEPQMPVRRSLVSFLSLALITLAVAACGLTDSSIDPDNIEVVLEGASGTQVVVVTSQAFTVGGSDESGVSVQLISADTTQVGLRYDRRVSLAPSYMFYVEALPVDPDAAPASLQMRVLVDGDERYVKSGTVGRDEFAYAYVYR